MSGIDATKTGRGAELSCEAISAIHEALKQTLGSIYGKRLETTAVEPAPPEGSGVSGAVAFEGDLSFVLVIGVPSDIVRPLSTHFTGVPMNCEMEVTLDLIGELANIAAGNIVARLEGLGLRTALSLPEARPTLDTRALVTDGTPSTKWMVHLEDGDLHVTVVETATGDDSPGGE